MTRPSRVPVLVAALALGVGSAVPAAAQDASPAASVPAVEPGEPSGSLEGAIDYIDPEGIVRGTISIRQANDPFTEFDPNGPPAEGGRYVQLVVTFEASEEETFPAEPSYVLLQDADGYVFTPAYVPRPAGAVPPDLQSQTLSPFDRVSGSIGYTVPASALIVRTIYRGDGQRLIPISQAVASDTPPLGEPRTVRTIDGIEQGTVTITEVADPYTAFEPTQPPAEGQRYVLLTAFFEAAADQPMNADPYAMVAVDDKGILYYPGYVPRPAGEALQNLDRQPLSPGDRISGAVGYVVPADRVLTGIVYAPEYNRFLSLVDLPTGG